MLTITIEETGFDKNGMHVRRKVTIRDGSPKAVVPRTNEDMNEHDNSYLNLVNRSSVPSSEARPEGFGLQPSQVPVREVDQWSSIHQDFKGRTYYFNCVTMVRRYEKPDCLKKYSAK